MRIQKENITQATSAAQFRARVGRRRCRSYCCARRCASSPFGVNAAFFELFGLFQHIDVANAQPAAGPRTLVEVAAICSTRESEQAHRIASDVSCAQVAQCASDAEGGAAAAVPAAVPAAEQRADLALYQVDRRPHFRYRLAHSDLLRVQVYWRQHGVAGALQIEQDGVSLQTRRRHASEDQDLRARQPVLFEGAPRGVRRSRPCRAAEVASTTEAPRSLEATGGGHAALLERRDRVVEASGTLPKVAGDADCAGGAQRRSAAAEGSQGEPEVLVGQLEPSRRALGSVDAASGRSAFDAPATFDHRGSVAGGLVGGGRQHPACAAGQPVSRLSFSRDRAASVSRGAPIASNPGRLINRQKLQPDSNWRRAS